MTTTKKIIIAVLVIAVLGGVAYWFFSSRAQTGNTNNPSGGFSIKSFFPFGNGNDVQVTNNDSSQNNNSDSTQSGGSFNQTGPVPKLRELSNKPVAGSVVWTTGSTSIVRFTEKATGNVYEARSDSLPINRLTNDTLPKIMRAFWLPDGTGFLAQTADDSELIDTSFIKLKLTSSSTSENTTPYEPVISKLPTGIEELSVSPDSKKVFYYTADVATSGYTANPDGTNKTQVFSNYLTEWIPNWFSTNSILISSKASSESPSNGYVLNPSSKTLSPAYNGIFGGSALPRSDGKYILVSSGGDDVDTWLDNVVSATTTRLGIHTLSEKCAWDPADLKFIYCAVPKSLGDNVPDNWYQGITQTDDLIYKINVFDNYKYLLMDLSDQSKQKIDVENISVSKDGNFLIFTNKIDQSLWLLDTR